MRICAASIMVCAILSGAIRAQELPAVPDEIIKELDGFAGTWEIEGKIGNLVETGEFACRWGLATDGRKCCLIGRYTYKTDDKTRCGVNVIGWDATKKCVEDRGFNSNGGSGTILWTIKSAEKWLGEMSFVEDGKEVKTEAVLIKRGPREFVIEGTAGNGEASRHVFRKVAMTTRAESDVIPQTRAKSVATRQSGQTGADPSKEAFMQLGDRLAGRWMSEFEADVAAEGVCEVGDKIVQSTSFDWVSNKTAILEKRVYAIGGKTIAEGAALISWDAPRKRIKSSYCDSLGGSWQSVWRMRGNDYLVQDRGVFGDGRESTGRMIARFSEDGNTVTYKLTDRVFGDETLPDIEYTHRRLQQ